MPAGHAVFFFFFCCCFFFKAETHIYTGTVYPQYVGIKKPLDGFSHYINIGVRMRE